MTYKLTNTSQPADPYYGAVSLLLHGDGANGSTQIIDSSPSPKTVTAVGDAQISTTESKWNGSSLKFDGTGDYLGLGVNNPDYAFGSGDFTVEAWVYRLDTNSGVIAAAQSDLASNAGSAWAFFVGTRNSVIYIGNSELGFASPQPSTNLWAHVAFCRNGGTIRSFLNGSIVGSNASLGTGSINTGSTQFQASVGGFSNGVTNMLNGYIDDFRITKGIARYTSNFTPPTQPFQSLSVRDPQFNAVSLLLKGEGPNGSTVIFDSSLSPKTVTASGNAQISTTESKWGSSSLKFDGTGDGLTVPDSSDFNFSNGDFTIELWVYFISLSGTNCIATDGWNSGVFSPWLTLQNNSNLQFFASSNGSSWDIATNLAIKSSASINTWYHIAVCRSGNTIRTFCDGINTGSVTSSAALVAVNSNIGIGANAIGGGDAINGYIDDFRITKGVARYTSNFTPPGPLPTF